MSALAEQPRSCLDVLSLEDARTVIENALGKAGEQANVIVDFDETLWLRNSTEEYLLSLRPTFLACAILLAIDAVRPWAFFRPKDARLLYRDWIRALVCIVLMPWSLAVWRRGAAERARHWRNATLIDWLARKGRRPIKVATLGLDVLVRPILHHIEARTAAQHLIYNPGTGALLYDADGSGTGAAVQFGRLSAGLHPGASSFRVAA